MINANSIQPKKSLKILAGLLLFLCLPFSFYARNQEQSYPNIVIILADDMGYGDLTCYNSESKIPTPNMDEVANAGLRFTDAHSPAAVCTPSRYGLLTGRYCWRTRLKRRVLNGYDPLLVDTSRTTIASYLKKKGYTTACIGKWHLGLGYRDSTDFYSKISPGPIELGFDYFYGISGSLNMRPFCFIRNHYTDGYLSVEKSPYNYPQQKGMMVPGWRDEQVDVAFVRETSRFIAEHWKQPFFVYLALSAPHTPHVQPYFVKNKSNAGPRGDMVLEVDWAVGQIRKNLERYNLLENTIIIITSDNGAEERNYDRDTRSFTGSTYGHKSNHIFRGQKADIFEGGHRVPFIVSWPGMIPEGQQTNKILCFTDIFPTIAGLFNESLPEDTGEDGFNLWPVWQHPSAGRNQRNHLVMHSALGVFAIRKGPWKLIMSGTSGGFGGTRASEGRFRAETPGQLYHLENDVREQNNVYSEYPEIVNQLTRLLQQIKMQGHSQIMD